MISNDTTTTHSEIKTIEVLRALDVYLAKFNCPYCGDLCLKGFTDMGKCENCGRDLSNLVIDLENAGRRNLVASVTKTQRKRIGKKLVRQLYDEQNGCCAYCDKPLKDYHVDHIIPVFVGGSNRRDNLVIACPRCNHVAGAKFFKTFYDKRNYLQCRIRCSQNQNA